MRGLAWVFAVYLERDVAAGAFRIEAVGSTAALIETLLDDCRVERTKHRQRHTAIRRYIDGVERAILVPKR